MRQIIFLFFFFKCRGITPTALHIDIVAYKITEFYNEFYTLLSKILFYTWTIYYISAYILKIIIAHKYDGSIRSDSTAQSV